MHKLQEKAP